MRVFITSHYNCVRVRTIGQCKRKALWYRKDFSSKQRLYALYYHGWHTNRIVLWLSLRCGGGNSLHNSFGS